MYDHWKANGNTKTCKVCGSTYTEADGSCSCDPVEYEAMIKRTAKELMKKISKVNTMLNVEKIAAGLRCCKKEPDFFITSELMAPAKVLEIPIYKVRYISFTSYGDSGLNLIPVWKDEQYLDQSYCFERGYEEYYGGDDGKNS